MNTITVLNKNKKDITANCDIEVSKSCSTDGSCTISNDTVTINKAGTYTIKYTVSYKGVLLDTITKTIIVKENKSSN
jgi:PKD repeat protein